MLDAHAPPGSTARDDWLRLYRSENVGPVTFRALLRQFGSASGALERLPELARNGGARRKITVCSRRAVEDELIAGRRLGARLVCLGEAAYPPALAAVETAPPVLWVLGDSAILKRETVAIVGARNASASGVTLARRLSEELGEHEIAVASGMARGIDTSAHDGALSNGTIAVLAGGIDQIYPPENADLYTRICDLGAIVSEMPIGMKPLARHFIRRNRIIAGLSRAVVVIEAARKSGSLSTAEIALEIGREVGAVPGSPLDPRCTGSNQLLKQGAFLVETASDVLEAMSDHMSRSIKEADASQFELPLAEPAPLSVSDQARHTIRDLLSPTPSGVDELVRISHLESRVVLAILLELEIAGRLERHAGQRVSIRPDT